MKVQLRWRDKHWILKDYADELRIRFGEDFVKEERVEVTKFEELKDNELLYFVEINSMEDIIKIVKALDKDEVVLDIKQKALVFNFYK